MHIKISLLILVTLLVIPVIASAQQPVRVTNLPADAAEGSNPATPPVPMGCKDMNTPTVITDTKMAYVKCQDGKVYVSTLDGDNVTQGAKADAKSTATDTTAVTIMQVLKEISFMAQNPAAQAVSYSGSTSGGTASMTGTTSTSVIAGTASNYIYVESCSVNNAHASVDTLVDLQDGSGGTVLWTFTAPHGYGGESHTFGTHGLKVPTSGNGLFAVDETTGAAVKVFCSGYKSTVSQ